MSECGYQYTAMPTIKPSTRGKNDEIRNNKDRKRKEKMQLMVRKKRLRRDTEITGRMGCEKKRENTRTFLQVKDTFGL